MWFRSDGSERLFTFESGRTLYYQEFLSVFSCQECRDEQYLDVVGTEVFDKLYLGRSLFTSRRENAASCKLASTAVRERSPVRKSCLSLS